MFLWPSYSGSFLGVYLNILASDKDELQGNLLYCFSMFLHITICFGHFRESPSEVIRTTSTYNMHVYLSRAWLWRLSITLRWTRCEAQQLCILPKTDHWLSLRQNSNGLIFDVSHVGLISNRLKTFHIAAVSILQHARVGQDSLFSWKISQLELCRMFWFL